MEMRTALLTMLILVVAVPTADALPALVSTCLRAPLATCVDGVSPRVQASNALPGMMVPDEPPAHDAPEAAPVPTSDAPMGDAPAAEPDHVFVPPAPESDGAASDVVAGRGLADASIAMPVLVALAALALVIFIMLLDRSEKKKPKSSRLVDAARAHAMQQAIDEEWKRARATR